MLSGTSADALVVLSGRLTVLRCTAGSRGDAFPPSYVPAIVACSVVLVTVEEANFLLTVRVAGKSK